MAKSDWLSKLLKWLKRSLGIRAERPSVRILYEHHSDGISVLQLADDSIPGCCELWRIDRYHERTKFFICCINIQTLREELGQLGIRRSDLSKHHGGGMVDRIYQQIADQEKILSTHYWITGWNKEYSAIDKQGRPYTSQRTYDVRVLACDLQGVAGVFNGDKYAKRFARKVIVRLAANEFREYAHHQTWQAAVRSIDWSGWLSGLAQSREGIDPGHQLQPVKSRARPRSPS